MTRTTRPHQRGLKAGLAHRRCWRGSLIGGLAGGLGLLAAFAAPAFAAPETPVTSPVTAVTATTAVLHGELNPGKPGGAGEYEFFYKRATEPVEPCVDEARSAPEPPEAEPGTEKDLVEAAVSELRPSQNYEVCLTVFSPGAAFSEFVLGNVVSFTTLPSAPAVFPETTKASNLTPFSATLEAGVNPNNQETHYSFEYATNEALTGAKTIAGGAPLAAEYGEVQAAVSTGLVLVPETTYYFRVTATDATGTIEGPVEHFTTLTAEKPVVDSEAVVALNSTEPEFEAVINPNYQETSYQFEYSTSATGEELEAPITVVKGAPPATDLPGVSEELLAGPTGIPGLQAGPTYFYRVTATNATGSTVGMVQSFQALAKPLVTLEAASSPARTTAIVSGTVTPQGLPTTYHFAYTTQQAYEQAIAEGAANPYATGRTTYQTSLEGAVDYTPHPVELRLEELAPATTYVYALTARNELGETTSPPGSFTTSPATPPLARPGPAEAISELSATITGEVATRGLPTTTQFEFGSTPYSGTMLPATVTEATGNVLTINDTFTNTLQPGTTYYYRTIAKNQDGTTPGTEQTFTTSSFPTTLTIPTTTPPIPYPTITQLDTQETKETPKTPPPPIITRAQHLTKALKACQHKPRNRRAACTRQAHKQYGPPPKKK